MHHNMVYRVFMRLNAELTAVIAELEKSGVTRGWMARQIGVSPGHFYGYLGGKRGLGLAAKKLLFQKLNLDEALLNRAS